MRSPILRSSLAAIAVMAGSGLLQAAEGDLPFELRNRLRVEYDDNIREEEDNADSSFKIIEELDLGLTLKSDNTFLSLSYIPSFIYWQDRDEDETDFQHQLDAAVRHSFSRSSRLNLKEVFRRSELPELTEDDVVVRQNNDFTYNSLNAAYEQFLSEKTSVDLNGRHVILRYDDDAASVANDYDQITGGFNLNQNVKPGTRVSGEFRYSTTDYEDNLRDYDAFQVGLALQNQLTKNVIAMLRGGFERREYDADIEDTDSPYVDGSVQITPGPDTSINLGVGYALSQTPTSNYVAQERTSISANLSQKMGPALTLNLSGSYSTGDFSVDDAIDQATAVDGSEDTVRLGARLNYELSRRNSIEAGWQYLSLDSDVRAADYDRNRVSIGWKTLIK